MASPLYDNYNAINSRSIRPYQGSIIPELVQVSQEMQKRYDEAQTQQDYISRFMNNLQALPQDEPALQEWAGQYKEKLKQISARPDLENTLRETTMLARDVPEGYAPFAQRIKEQQDYEKGLMDRKDILPETRQQIIAMSRGMYGGMKKDPSTGRYIGKYTGYDAVDDIDFNKKIQDYVQGTFPTSVVTKSAGPRGEWIVKTGSETKILDERRISEIVRSGMQSDPQMQAWLRQQQDLGTWNTNWNALEGMELTPEAQTALKPYVERGLSVSQAAKQFERDRIAGGWENKALQYAVPRFYRKDTESSYDLDTNQNYWNAINRQDKLDENRMLQMATVMTIGGAKVNNVEDFRTVAKSMTEGKNAEARSFADWFKGIGNKGGGVVKYKNGTVDAQGRPRVFYKDEEGKEIEVTQQANEFRDRINLFAEREKEMGAVEKYAAEQSGWNKVPQALKTKAEAARVEEIDKIRRASARGDDLAASFTEEEVIKAGEKAFQKVLQNTKQYQEYERILKQKTQGTDVGADLFLFAPTRSESVSKRVTDMVAGLGKNGLIPVWDNEGKQLSGKLWDEMKGDMKAIGVTYTGDPNSPTAIVMRVYKDVQGKKTAGSDMIVKIPHTSIQNFIDNDMDAGQRYYFNGAKNLAQGLNNPTKKLFIPAGQQGNKLPITITGMDNNQGWKVKVGNQEHRVDNFKDMINFMTTQQ